MYPFLVYFASVAGQIQAFCIISAVIVLIGSLIYSTSYSDTHKKPLPIVQVVGLIFLGTFFALSSALIPYEKQIYKIAATIGQDKTVLSPLGDVKQFSKTLLTNKVS